MGLRKRGEEEAGPRWLEVNASMTGTLSFKDPVHLQINGQFEGNLDTKGSLSVGDKAQVKATIHGEVISIAGFVEGSITATRRVELLPTAKILGKITSPKLIVHEGAVLHGQCEMQNQKTETQWMNVDELARYLEVDNNTVLDWAQSGRLPAQKEGNQWKFDRGRIEEWLSHEKVK